jgi:hypothetical protein
MTPRCSDPRPGEAGFVLIGVVIFVIALTIIGISLFSLSSYEAQFLQRSTDEEQAFQSAVGGIERAKFMLTRTSRLPSVKDALPIENVGVGCAVAIQDHGGVGDSMGQVNWQGTEVRIRVTAEVNGARRTVEGLFMPKDSVALNYYSSLITVSGGIGIEDHSPLAPDERDQTVLLDGLIWESSPLHQHVWLDHLESPRPDSIRKHPAVPVPDVAPFFDASGPYGTAQMAVELEPIPTTVSYTLDASGTPGVPVYFRAEDTDAYFSLNTFPQPGHPWNQCVIQVHGLAVWLLPHGAMFYEATTIAGDPTTDCLVVIAGPEKSDFGSSQADGPTSSICSLGYLQTSIPVVFVSSGEVLLWHENDWDRPSFASDLAIFARSVRFMGPYVLAFGSPELQLRRAPNGPLNTSFLDALASQGALPNATSSGRRLDLVAGSWQASDR